MVWRWLKFTVKWILVGLGGFLWCMLWYQRSPILGFVQLCLIAALLVRELSPQLSGKRRDDALRGPQDPPRTV